MKHFIRVFTLLQILYPHTVLSAVICESFNPFPNYRVLDETELLKYNITSQPCTAACVSGYFGDFCDSIIQAQPATRGPWNSAGYYTDSQALRKMTLDTTNVRYVQYSNKEDGAVIGIRNPTYSVSALISISLYNRISTTILLPHTATGSLDALRITRGGEIFVARSASFTGPFDVALYLGQGFAEQKIVSSERVLMMEVFLDKGMNTTILYTGSYKVVTYFSNGYSSVWANSIPGITGLACGWGCPSSVFFTVGLNVKSLASTGTVTTLISEPVQIYCLTSVPNLNVLFYHTGTEVKQASFYGSSSTSYTSYPGIITGASATACSVDVSNSLTQVMLVQAEATWTQTTLQLGCPYKQTAPEISSIDKTMCIACPSPPGNAFTVLDTVSCEWECSSGYTKSGSACILDSIPFPCPAYYTFAKEIQKCVPSTIPWAMDGQFVSSIQESSMLTLSPVQFPPYLQAADAGYNYMSANGKLYVSQTFTYDSGVLTIQTRTPTSSACSYDQVLRDNYLIQAKNNIIWLAFTVRGSSPAKHCLWMVEVTLATKQARVASYWDLSGKLCSVDSGEGNSVYMILCGTNYIFQASTLTSASKLVVLAGKLPAGHRDGTTLNSLFDKPSSLIYFNKRIYVTDQKNCVIREIDIDRSMVYTSAGKQGVCVRTDSVDTGESAGLAYPTRLIRTPFDGFCLFFDKYPWEGGNTIRQFHAHTHAVKTIRSLIYSDITSFLVQPSAKIIVAYQSQYQEITANAMDCRNGFVALPGNALSEGDCIPCDIGKFSSKSKCVECSKPVCTNAWQAPVACSLGQDSYCGSCTNKPSGVPSVYVKAGTGFYNNQSDCEWAFLSPCPVGYYLNSTLGYCVACPPWSTTASTGATSRSQCFCLGSGTWSAQGTCIVPSVYKPGLSPLPSSLAVVTSCDYSTTENPTGICPCQPGEYISQFYPKVCTACPDNWYSPDGFYCRPCPSLQESSLDKVSCRCSNGLKDIDLVLTQVQCACDKGNEFKNQQCSSCPANTFQATSALITQASETRPCSACAPGTFSSAGSTQCTACSQGWYREASMPACSTCPTQGHYATDPTSGSSCIPCMSTCNGRKESLCPNSGLAPLYVCSDCPPPRAHSTFNGGRDCATSCDAGYFEQEGECRKCSIYNETNCPVQNGLKIVQCTSYADSDCKECFNVTKPLYYSQWGQDCSWSCVAGYKASKALPDGTIECVKEGAWSLWDLFTF
jgi:hypothetical protein